MRAFFPITFIFTLLVTYHLSLVSTFAQDDIQHFITNYETTYAVNEEGDAKVNQQKFMPVLTHLLLREKNQKIFRQFLAQVICQLM
jgi:hypothetical protein